MTDHSFQHGWGAWGTLTVQQQKWVLSRLDFYSFVTADPFSHHETPFVPPAEYPRNPLYVQTPQYRVERSARRAEKKILEVMGRNLAWGIETLLPATAQFSTKTWSRVFFTQPDPDPFVHEGHIGVDPGKWPEQCEAKLTRMTELRDQLTTDIAAMSSALRSVRDMGWDKFLAEYREAIKRELIK